ncbi:MAG: ferritin family protein [Spirochaetales bacterium]|nr:ferritin family protein [Spirochaetales bacterium]
MGVRFNIEEVFTMAIKIEENGAAFYRRAAELNKGNDNVKLFENLARMEDIHKKTFEEMRGGLVEEHKQEQAFDPFNEAVLYLNATADMHGGEGSKNIADSLTGKETLQEIITIALELEKKSILYYLGLKDLVPEKAGKDKIDIIIGEEKKHIVQLQSIMS